jgi:hypothetical protein
MSDDAPDYRIGDVGENAVVQQGENLYNYNISLHIQDLKDTKEADALLRLLRGKGERLYYGPLLRRLDPVVLVNRREQIAQIANFFGEPSASILYVLGLPAIGKSTLVRGALEFRQANTPVVWITAEGLDTDRLLMDINAGLQLEVQTVITDQRAQLTEKIAAVLGAIRRPSILVLDGFEAVLDDDGGYLSDRMEQAMEALATLEHQAKVLVTTRRLPQGVGEGSLGIQILRLGGLSDEMAEEFLRERSHLDAQAFQTVLSAEALKKLRGHPKFIELFASAIAEAPAEQVVNGLLEATDIGEFIQGQVLKQLSREELDVLRAAAVFREGFTFEALSAVHGGKSLTQPVRTLVRRAVLEVARPQTAYYLHPLLREAVPREPEQEAAAHAAAARWFLREPIVPSDLRTWDDGLYHLRLAAELGRVEKYFRPYSDFLHNNNRELSFAGWGRRLLKETKALEAVAEHAREKLGIRWMLGLELLALNEKKEAEIVLRDVIKGFTEEMQQAASEKLKSEIAESLVMIKEKLGSVLLKQNRIEEAEQLANEIEPTAEATQNLQYKLRYKELRFGIANKRQDGTEMLRWAKDCLELAQQWSGQKPSLQTKDALASAHFSMGASYLLLKQYPDAFYHIGEQLRILLEIGNITGAAKGLYNLGVIVSLQDQSASGALLLTSEQIEVETGIAQDASARQAVIEKIIQQLLAKDENIEAGRKALQAISDKLPPYYERALARCRNSI